MTSAPESRQAGAARPLNIAIIAGEHSGDALGAKLMDALKATSSRDLKFSGVGGDNMEHAGFRSLFPLHEVAVMGPLSILRHLPRLVRRVYNAVDGALAANPDIVVIIDAPEFTHPIAKRIRKRKPYIPIIDYVSPSVWAWRSGRAPKMRAYIDHVLALLPFEPDVHKKLGGPPCTYVGHPLIEKLDAMRSAPTAELVSRFSLDPKRPVLVVLPGSRSSEIGRLMEPFGQTVQLLIAAGVEPEIIVPAVASKRELLERELAKWPLNPHLVFSHDDKIAAFNLATAALAASGTVTLELALCRAPAVVGYRVDPIAAPVLRRAIKAPSVVLPNLIAGDNIYPEFHQEACNPEDLAKALAPLFGDTPQRRAQLAALDKLPDQMQPPDRTPSLAAASIVLSYAERTVKPSP